MDPIYPPEAQDSSSGYDGHDVTSWVSVCSRGLCRVQRRLTHKRGRQTISTTGDDRSWSASVYPRMGSLCRVRVRLKADLGDPESPISDKGEKELSTESDQPIANLIEVDSTATPRSENSVLQVPLGDWTMLKLGEGQCDITETCVEGMRAEEKCEILLSPLENGPEATVPQSAEGRNLLCATVELHSFTPGKESWEMSPGEKWEWVRSHKERGGVRYRSGDVWGAADSYSRALKLLITLRSHTADAKTKEREQQVEDRRDASGCGGTQKPPADSPLPSANEYKTVKAELHSNLSLCQLKLSQPERARANAAKATQLEPGGAKAWYRLGQACQMVNELEEARQAFKRLLELQPDSPAAMKALKDVASREKETNTQLGQRLSKMFG
ncbi:FK506-binding protein-like isoform 2-T4 [Polymixia lowei]